MPNGYIQLPIFNEMDPHIIDDIDFNGCSFISEGDNYNFPAESTYKNFEYLKNELRYPFRNAFNLTVSETLNMSFMTLYGYCDIV